MPAARRPTEAPRSTTHPHVHPHGSQTLVNGSSTFDVSAVKLLRKVAVVAAAVVLILAVLALIQGEVHDAVVGFFVSACALLTSGVLRPDQDRPPRKSRKG